MQDTQERQRNQILLVLFVGVLMAALDIAIVGPALPAIKVAYGVDEHGLASVFTIYLLLNLVGTPIIGRLSDMFGRRLVYTLSVAAFAAGSLVVAVAPSFGLLLAGRALQGLGAGGIFPVASAVIGDTFPPERRGRALGLIGAVFGIAFLLGPILGGALLLLGWQWLFLINLPIAALVIIAALRQLPGPALQPSEQLELRAMAMFRNRQVLLVGLLALGAGLSEAVTLFIPSLLVESFQVSPSTASFMLIPMVLAMAIASPSSGRVLDSAGSRVVVVAGAALIGVSLFIEGLFAASLPLYYVFAVLFGLGIGVLLGASLRYIMLNEAAPTERGAAQALLTLALGIGQLGGAALMGAIAARQGGTLGYTTALLASGGIMLLLTLLATQLKDRRAEIATRQQDQPAGA